MNDEPRDLTDDGIRDLLAHAGADAPTPQGWDELIERSDEVARRRTRHRRRWALAAAAAIVALGSAGLIATLQARSGDDDPIAVDPPTEPAVPDAPNVVEDPLAGLSADDWIVPTALPVGYEILVALEPPGGGPDGGRLLVGGDEVAEVSIETHAVREQTDDATNAAPGLGDVPTSSPVDVGGLAWSTRASVDSDGVVRARSLERQVNDRLVSLTTDGSLEVLVQIAAQLTAVPDADLDVPRLNRSLSRDASTIVAEAGEAELAVGGVNGVFCLGIVVGEAIASTCGARTEPATPIVVAISSEGPDGSFVAGLAEPTVVRVEFTTSEGDVVAVEPVDDSAVFHQRFWITDQLGAALGGPGDLATITYDSGATAEIAWDVGGVWTFVDAATQPEPRTATGAEEQTGDAATSPPSTVSGTTTTEVPLVRSTIDLPIGSIEPGPDDLFVLQEDGDLSWHRDLLSGVPGEIVRLVDMGDPREIVDEGPGPNVVEHVAGVVDGSVIYGDCCEPVAGNVLAATEPDSERIQVSFGYSPTLSPDGGWLATVNQFEIAVVDTATGEYRGLPTNDVDQIDRTVQEAVWVTDEVLAVLFWDDDGYWLLPMDAETLESQDPVSLGVDFDPERFGGVRLAGVAPSGHLVVTTSTTDSTRLRFFDVAELSEVEALETALPADVTSVRVDRGGSGLLFVDDGTLVLSDGDATTELGDGYLAAWFVG